MCEQMTLKWYCVYFNVPVCENSGNFDKDRCAKCQKLKCARCTVKHMCKGMKRMTPTKFWVCETTGARLAILPNPNLDTLCLKCGVPHEDCEGIRVDVLFSGEE